MASYAEINQEYTINAKYEELYNALKDVPSSTLGDMATELEGALTRLSSQINIVVDALKVGDTWDDAISAEVNSSSTTGIDAIINGCKSPGFELLHAIQVSYDPFVTELTEYYNEVNNYNTVLYPAWKAVLDNKPNPSDYHDKSDPNDKTKVLETGYEQYIKALTKWENDEKKPAKKASEDAIDKIKEYE